MSTIPNYYFSDDPSHDDLDQLSDTDLIDAMKQHIATGKVEAAQPYLEESKARMIHTEEDSD